MFNLTQTQTYPSRVFFSRNELLNVFTQPTFLTYVFVTGKGNVNLVLICLSTLDCSAVLLINSRHFINEEYDYEAFNEIVSNVKDWYSDYYQWSWSQFLSSLWWDSLKLLLLKTSFRDYKNINAPILYDFA